MEEDPKLSVRVPGWLFSAVKERARNLRGGMSGLKQYYVGAAMLVVAAMPDELMRRLAIEFEHMVVGNTPEALVVQRVRELLEATPPEQRFQLTPDKAEPLKARPAPRRKKTKRSPGQGRNQK